jgi:hypothetical protein
VEKFFCGVEMESKLVAAAFVVEARAFPLPEAASMKPSGVTWLSRAFHKLVEPRLILTLQLELS